MSHSLEMNAMTAKDSLSSISREGFSPGEPLTLVGICLDEDTWLLLKAFAERAPLALRENFDKYQVAENDSVAEWIGKPAPNICLIDFDKDRRSATIVAEKIHASAPETAIFAVSEHSQPELIIQSMRSGCSEYLVKPIDREQMGKLLNNGKTDVMDKFVSKTGRNFAAYLVLGEDGKVTFEFPPREELAPTGTFGQS